MYIRATAVLFVAMVASSALCQQINPPEDFVQGRWAGWIFQEENDVLAPGNTDKYYTQGLRYSKVRNPKQNWAPIDCFGDWFVQRFDNQLNAANVWSIGLGQNIYTPDDITNPNPQMNDRPWGAFLYIDNTLQIIDKDAESRRHLFELQTGIVGPGAAGRWAQSTIHHWIGSAHPKGWSNQLKNEPGVNLIYSYDRRYSQRYVNFVDTDLQPYAGGSLGTVMTYADAGALVRLGHNNTGFLNGALRASAVRTNFNGNRPPWEFYVYGGAEGRAVGHNIFLSGGTFRQIPIEIEPRRFVYDIIAGASLRYRRWRLTYNHVTRSSEFTHPLAAGNGRQKFGSIVLSVERIIP